MAATKTATIRIGNFTRQVTKAGKNKAAVIAQCIAIAEAKGLVILVKRDFAGRWQGYCNRRNARGMAGMETDYRWFRTGRLAVKSDTVTDGGLVYFADTNAASGEVIAEVIHG